MSTEQSDSFTVYGCSYCEREFLTSEARNGHEQDHRGETIQGQATWEDYNDE